MRKECKLILVEGLCGTGKSTLAERLHRYFVQQDISTSFFDEGAKGHPASLNWHAFFREEEFKALIQHFPNEADVIQSQAIKDGNFYLIPYRELEAFSQLNPLYAELKSRELCWTDSPIATLTEYTYLIQQHWKRFAESVSPSETVFVVEAVFFQHQIHDLLKHYQADDRQIEQHIQGITDQIVCMNPVMFYLSQRVVREQQVWISTIRSKPQFATEKNIRFMENRKRIELGLLDRLTFPSYRIENENRDWDYVLSKMVQAIKPHIR